MLVRPVLSSMFVTKIEEHEEYKERLLSLIDEMPESSYETVTRTDWNVSQDIPREYLKLFYQEILYGKNKYMEKQNKFYEVDELPLAPNTELLRISNGWYQQYTNNSQHIWHRHGEVNFTNVYFLELPNKEHRTEIKDVEYDAEEGYLITFPAMLLHRCKKVSGGRKTVISFNTNFV